MTERSLLKNKNHKGIRHNINLPVPYIELLKWEDRKKVNVVLDLENKKIILEEI